LVGRCAGRLPEHDGVEGFNPRPTNWSGDAGLHGELWERTYRFNPRPTNWSGDALNVRFCARSSKCFNPRPTNWSGDAGADRVICLVA